MAKEDCVDVQVRNVPKKLLVDFDKEIVEPLYPGGRAEAIRALMRKVIDEQRLKGA